MSTKVTGVDLILRFRKQFDSGIYHRYREKFSNEKFGMTAVYATGDYTLTGLLKQLLNRAHFASPLLISTIVPTN